MHGCRIQKETPKHPSIGLWVLCPGQALGALVWTVDVVQRPGSVDQPIALMTPWFGRFVDLPPAPSYFHLCPACWAEKVEPFADHAMEKLWEMHPDARPEEE